MKKYLMFILMNSCFYSYVSSVTNYVMQEDLEKFNRNCICADRGIYFSSYEYISELKGVFYVYIRPIMLLKGLSPRHINNYLCEFCADKEEGMKCGGFILYSSSEHSILQFLCNPIYYFTSYNIYCFAGKIEYFNKEYGDEVNESEAFVLYYVNNHVLLYPVNNIADLVRRSGIL